MVNCWEKMVERRHMVNDDTLLQKNAEVCTSARTAVRQVRLVTPGCRVGTMQVLQKPRLFFQDHLGYAPTPPGGWASAGEGTLSKPQKETIAGRGVFSVSFKLNVAVCEFSTHVWNIVTPSSPAWTQRGLHSEISCPE